ncbi:MAG: DUF559 domain-containing protein [Oscillochloris sp.]|nr:DUF559 domain-containing protein [Oscillochloris sp.]
MPRRSGTRPSPALRARSAELRRKQTPAEQMLWQRLRGGKAGTKFRRQHALDRFIADFCSLEHHLIVEVDGPVHQQQTERDAERTMCCASTGRRWWRRRSRGRSTLGKIIFRSQLIIWLVTILLVRHRLYAPLW